MTQILLPPNNRTVGQGNPPADMNEVTTALMAMSATSYVAPTGDTSGATDAANIAAAISAHGGVLLGPGTFYTSATIDMTSGQFLIGAGKWSTIINWVGTGDCIRALDTSTYTTRTVDGGGVIGVTINGSGAGAGSCALHAGDILQYQADLAVTGFSGAGDIGLHFDNESYWTEQAKVSAWINGCTTDVVFDCGGATTSAGSYDRGDFTFYVQHTTFTGDSIVFQNGAYLTGGRLRLFGNYSSSNTTFTQAVLSLTGSAPGGHPASYSNLSTCELDINIESDESLTYTFQTVNYGSTNNTITDCSGNVSFGAGNQFTASNITTLSSQFTFFGPVVGDTTLAEVTIPSRMAVNGEAFFHSEISSQLATSVSYKPSNPAGTTSTTAVMMGLGATCTFTPNTTGKVRVTICGTWYSNAGPDQGTISGRYGTGTAPANGVASTGTRFGTGSSDWTIKAASSGFGVPFSFTEILALTAGDTYWVDLAESVTSGATTETGNIVVSIDELLA
jgi:hypothetical protein